MSAVVANKPVRFIGIFSIVIGVIMILAGAGVYIYASNTLRVQNMTVSAVTPEEPGALADKVVAGPFTALAQANAINHHALAATGDRSYSDLGADVNAAKAQFAELVGGDEEAIGALNAAVNARNAGPLADLDISDEARAVADTAIADQTLRMGTSIITAASLSFLGMGAQPPTPEWGAMLNEARADMVNAPHVALFPSLAIFFTVLAFNLLGDGLRDALDPKIDHQ